MFMHTYALCGYTRHLRTCQYAAIHINRPSGISQAAAIAANRTQGVLSDVRNVKGVQQLCIKQNYHTTKRLKIIISRVKKELNSQMSRNCRKTWLFRMFSKWPHVTHLGQPQVTRFASMLLEADVTRVSPTMTSELTRRHSSQPVVDRPGEAIPIRTQTVPNTTLSPCHIPRMQ